MSSRASTAPHSSIPKKAVAVLASIAIAASSLAIVSATPSQAQAATTDTPHMKTLSLKWDLKPNKARKVKETFAGLSKKKGDTVKLRKWKMTRSGDGYKKLTFTVSFTRNYKLTKNEAHKCVNSKTYKRHWSVCGQQWFSVADWDTGRDLESYNPYGVKVTSKWSTSGYRMVKDKHGCWLRTSKYTNVKVTITYPESYQGLCIGVGGSNLSYSTSVDASYWKGKVAFGKTNMYKKGKTNSHWMHVG